MQVPETDITWTYSLLKASQDKSIARTGVAAGGAAELVGVDGSNDGGIQPFPGFREMHRFAPEAASGTKWGGTNPYSGVAHRCRIVDFWSFSVIAGASTRVFGFVYLVRRANTITAPQVSNNEYDLMMEYYAPQTGFPNGKWSTEPITVGIQAADASILADGGKAVMSIETTGKAIYIFRRGVSPVAVYFKYTVATTSTTPTILEGAGPGKRVNAVLFSGDFGAASTHSTSNFPDPTAFAGGVYTNAPGSVVFCRNDPSVTPAGGGTAPTAISNLSTAPSLDAGSYSLAVQFEDSRSGRKSQICNNVDLTFSGSARRLFIDGVYDSNRFDTLNIYRTVRTNSAGGSFTNGVLQLEAQITLSGGTPDYEAGSLSGITPGSYGAGTKFFRYAYQLKDAALVMQDVFLDKPSYSTTMPKGGAGALLDGTMLVGNISESASDLTGTGETRWSASGAESPELFSASGIYKPSNVGDAVTCFKRTGQIMTGFTRNGIQIFSKQNGYIRVLGAHQGYGITGPYAAATVGPISYYMNYRGLKAIFPDGRLDNVTSIDDLVMDEWYSGTTGAQELSKVSMAFDPATLCLYVLNPTRQQAVQMWFSTGIVSELQDMSFAKVTQGWWQDSDGQLVPRALFLFNAPLPDVVTNTNFRPAVYMPCRTYGDKTYPEAAVVPPVYMLDCEAAHASTNDSAVLTTYSFFPPQGTWTTRTNKGVTASLGGKNPFTASATVAARMIGASVYVSYTTSKGDYGAKAIIVNATGSEILLAGVDPNNNADLPAIKVNDEIVLDPVFVRWVGAPLRMGTEKEEEFVLKQPSSIGAVFTDVEVTTGKEGNYRYWYAGIYRENEETPILEDVPEYNNGTILAKSIERGDTSNWVSFGKHGIFGIWFSPFFETWIPNLKYRLVGIQVKGRILPTDRSKRGA